MEIKILNNKYNLLNESKDYYLIIRDIIGNTLTPVQIAIETYRFKKDRISYTKFKVVAEDEHKKFDELFENVLRAKEINNITSRLNVIINILNKESSFDWEDIEKFEKFYYKCEEILKLLKEL